MHPDSHAIVELPGTDSAIYGSDGGLVRTSATFTNISSQCASRGLSPTSLATCQQLLSAVPSTINSLNEGLSTLQFQSLSVAADDPNHLQGGTQDNGTFDGVAGAGTWPQEIYGDGGQSGFSATNSSLRFNSFTANFHDVNFQNGDPTKWVIASGPIAATEPGGAQFYAPIIADPNPAAAGTIFEGSLSVWRTQDWAGGQAFLEANCPEFTTAGDNPACGDFVRIGPSRRNEPDGVRRRLPRHESCGRKRRGHRAGRRATPGRCGSLRPRVASSCHRTRTRRPAQSRSRGSTRRARPAVS